MRAGPDQPAIGCVRTGFFHTDTPAKPGTTERWSALHLLLFILLSLPWSYPVHAGDEDLNPSIYQIFDPVTGFTIEVEQPPDDQQTVTSQQTHPATQTTQASQGPAATVTIAQDNTIAVPESSTGLKPVVVATGIFLLILIASLAFRLRKAQHTST